LRAHPSAWSRGCAAREGAVVESCKALRDGGIPLQPSFLNGEEDFLGPPLQAPAFTPDRNAIVLPIPVPGAESTTPRAIERSCNGRDDVLLAVPHLAKGNVSVSAKAALCPRAQRPTAVSISVMHRSNRSFQPGRGTSFFSRSNSASTSFHRRDEVYHHKLRRETKPSKCPGWPEKE